MIITLDEAKKHLVITHDLDNILIEDYIMVAEELIEKDINRDLNTVIKPNGEYPSVLKHAAKVLVSTFYENREAVTVGVSVNENPYSYKYLIGTYKKYAIS